MRLSNFFIYGSLTVIIAASVGFLIFKSMPSDDNDATTMAARIQELETKNSDLVNQSVEDAQQISSLNDQLRRASQLTSDKDLEITQLKKKAGTDSLAQDLAPVLNCQPSEVDATVNRLVADYKTVHQQLQIVNGQLSQLMAKRNPGGDGTDNKEDQDDNARPPRIKKLELNAPSNQWANRGGKQDSGKQDSGQTDGKIVEPAGEAADQKLAAKNEAANGKSTEGSDTNLTSSKLVNTLNTQIETLKAELRNREKLLFEQTSLIEDLKKKSRIETGFRTENNGVIVEPVRPFRDNGTFPIRSN